jgi:hypothetical protein
MTLSSGARLGPYEDDSRFADLLRRAGLGP